MGTEEAQFTGCSQKPAAQESERMQLFKAMAVLDMCRLACASKLVGFDPEQLSDALVVVQELMNGVAAAMEPPSATGAAETTS